LAEKESCTLCRASGNPDPLEATTVHATMTTPFTRRDFTRYYDLLHSDKNYPAECDLVEDVFRRYSDVPPHTILDAGCGSGGHGVHLAKRGYDLFAVDRSASLLEIEKKRSDDAGLRSTLMKVTCARFSLDRHFDACISMFAVMGFQ